MEEYVEEILKDYKHKVERAGGPPKPAVRTR